jgi:flagellar hook-associated protein 1 FlgK
LYDLVDSKVVGGLTFSNAYADLVADVGSRSLSAQTSSKLSTQQATDATAARDKLGGVNLDEEAARLMQYQQAYQAAAKIIDGCADDVRRRPPTWRADRTASRSHPLPPQRMNP